MICQNTWETQEQMLSLWQKVQEMWERNDFAVKCKTGEYSGKSKSVHAVSEYDCV